MTFARISPPEKWEKATKAAELGKSELALAAESYPDGVDGLDPTGLLSGISIYTILLAVLFGLVGFAAFRYGRKNAEPRPLMLGIALMAYGYFVSNPWVSLAIGSALTLALFFPREI
jgi:MFS family permease